MKQVLFLFLLFCPLFLSDVSAQQQSASKVLKHANKALGGEKALRNVKSLMKSGTITRVRDGASGAFLMQGAAPNFYNESYELGGFETEFSFNGKSAWLRDSREGLKTLSGAESRDFQAEANFRNNLWLDYKKEKAKLLAKGQTKIDGKTVNSLILTTVKGVSIKLYFDAASGLLLREEIPAGDLTKTFDYGDYRSVGGVFEPFTITAKIGDDSYAIKLEKVIHNQQIAQTDFDFPQISRDPLPDIQAFLRESQINEDRNDEILENYSYTQKSILRAIGKDGVLRETESATYQLSFYKGNRIRRLIEKNDKPLGAEEQADEDKKVQKEVAEIEKRLAKREKENKTKEKEDRFSVAELLRGSLLKNPRRERLRGRDVIVFDFEPNPKFDMKNAESMLKFFGKVGGVMWIDEKDKQVARIEAALFDSFKVGGGLLASLRKGATFTLEQERVNDEVWLPSMVDVNLSVKVFMIKGINLNQIVKSYNYRKFNTEITDTKIDEIKNPQ
jgi:hypothetical protein